MPEPGELIAGKLRLVRRLGAGGMGVVYEAVQVHLGRRVAVKLIRASESQLPEARTRFMREARAQALLPLEHIVQVLDVDCLPDGSPYIVMEYLDGRDLKRELKKRGVLPVGEAVSYVAQACRGAAAAHAAGIVHRDLKPQNIFVTNLEGVRRVKLLDFGVAKFLESPGQDLTATSEVVGTPTHLAPEQIAGGDGVDARVDLWALGIVLFELLSGQTPFRRGTALATLAAVANDPPPPLAELRPDAPAGLVEVVERCLAKSPDARFQSADELREALAPYATFDGTVPSELQVGRGSSIPAPGNPDDLAELPIIVPPSELQVPTVIAVDPRPLAESLLPRQAAATLTAPASVTRRSGLEPGAGGVTRFVGWGLLAVATLAAVALLVRRDRPLANSSAASAASLTAVAPVAPPSAVPAPAAALQAVPAPADSSLPGAAPPGAPVAGSEGKPASPAITDEIKAPKHTTHHPAARVVASSVAPGPNPPPPSRPGDSVPLHL